MMLLVSLLLRHDIYNLINSYLRVLFIIIIAVCYYNARVPFIFYKIFFYNVYATRNVVGWVSLFLSFLID